MIAFTTIGARAGSRHLARFLHQVGRRNLSSVNGKVYAISGAASGVGLETAKVLHGMGARLSITDNRKEALEASIKEIIESNPGKQSEILSTVTDVRSSDQVKNWITRTISEFGALDGAANVAGVLGSSVGVKDLSELSDEEWDFIISVNQKGMFYALREQIKGLDSLGEGPRSIVNVSSVAGLYGDMRNACYSASKHAVVGLTRSVAKEVGRKGIRVNAVAPGYILTPMSANLPKELRAGLQWLLQGQALGRQGSAREIAQVIAFLLSPDSSFVTGAVYLADGGQLC